MRSEFTGRKTGRNPGNCHNQIYTDLCEGGSNEDYRVYLQYPATNVLIVIYNVDDSRSYMINDVQVSTDGGSCVNWSYKIEARGGRDQIYQIPCDNKEYISYVTLYYRDGYKVYLREIEVYGDPWSNCFSIIRFKLMK